MRDNTTSHIRSTPILFILSIILVLGCSQKEPAPVIKGIQEVSATVAEIKTDEKAPEIAVQAPPFTEGIFPCTECHAYMDPNPVRRELIDFHDDVDAMFDHDSENRWCLDCHDLVYRDSLRLASGKLLDFKESYKLCGQCHGDKYRDWKVGVHGKRTGEWNGKKEYLLCVHCHNPHSPKFDELTPEPPPTRQEEIK